MTGELPVMGQWDQGESKMWITVPESGDTCWFGIVVYFCFDLEVD